LTQAAKPFGIFATIQVAFALTSAQYFSCACHLESLGDRLASFSFSCGASHSGRESIRFFQWCNGFLNEIAKVESPGNGGRAMASRFLFDPKIAIPAAIGESGQVQTGGA
jgi:hypothetical protein